MREEKGGYEYILYIYIYIYIYIVKVEGEREGKYIKNIRKFNLPRKASSSLTISSKSSH